MRRVGIFGSKHQTDKLLIIKRLFEKLVFLETEIYVESKFNDYLAQELKYEPSVTGIISDDDFDLDVALSLGGDGTFLRTAARIYRRNIPILGINTGRLGFLADVGGNEVEDTLDELFKNYYKVEERTLLKLHTDDRRFQGCNYALNEIAILKRDSSSMITIDAWANDVFINSYQADGLLISTSTGSTAYSMSVGGPIVVPQAPNFIITPIAPHSLNVRPIIIPDDWEIKLRVESRNNQFLIALDGRNNIFDSKTHLLIKKAGFTTKVVKRENNDFFDTLRSKLMWGMSER
jgi:NAD+ kinase